MFQISDFCSLIKEKIALRATKLTLCYLFNLIIIHVKPLLIVLYISSIMTKPHITEMIAYTHQIILDLFP